MVLGFISLILTFTQSYIPRICVPHNVANTMLPCPLGDSKDIEDKNRRGLLWNSHRLLASGAVDSSFCTKKGKTSLVSNNGLHQLHRFIFFLAVIHVAYSVVTMTLGIMKIRTWKGWEQEALSQDNEFSNGSNLECEASFSAVLITQDLDLLTRHRLSEDRLVSVQEFHFSFILSLSFDNSSGLYVRLIISHCVTDSLQ